MPSSADDAAKEVVAAAASFRPAGMTRRERFWRWVYRLADLRVRQCHMERRRHDRRCPHCGRWGAHHGWTDSRVDPDHPMRDLLTCGACGEESTWWAEAMAPFPVDRETGTELPAHPLAEWERR